MIGMFSFVTDGTFSITEYSYSWVNGEFVEDCHLETETKGYEFLSNDYLLLIDIDENGQNLDDSLEIELSIKDDVMIWMDPTDATNPWQFYKTIDF